jgi:hypothetical protein
MLGLASALSIAPKTVQPIPELSVRRDLSEMREAPGVTNSRSGERLVFTRALALMKRPQN